MEVLLVLLAIFLLVAPLVALGISLSMRGRLMHLEDRLATLEKRLIQGGLQRSEEKRADHNVAVSEQPPPLAPVVREVPVPTPFEPARLYPRLEIPARPPETMPQSHARTPADSEVTPGLEERLGTRFFVYVGAIALALAGTYLVKYTFDRGLIGPSVRVVAGSLFGLVLIVAGEFLRHRTARIAQAVTAAGVADLFACLLAATSLYKLISPMMGFTLLAANTALAVALSLRQGPFVALLGLVGGFLTPVLIRTGEARVSLFVYLFILELGLIAVTRKRRWPALTGLTLVCGMGWAVAWSLLFLQPEHRAWLGAFVLVSIGAFVLSVQAGRLAWGDRKPCTLLTWLSMAAGVLALCTQLCVTDFASMEWGFLGLLGAGCILVGRLRPELRLVPALTAIVTVAMLLVWGGDEADHPTLALTLLALGTLYVAGPYAALWGSQHPQVWTAMSGLASLAFFSVGRATSVSLPPELTWARICILLGCLWIAGSVGIGRLRRRSEAYEFSLDTATVFAALFIALAAWYGLRHEWIAVAWSGQLVVMAAIYRVLTIRSMSHLLGILGVAILIRLFNPGVTAYPLGSDIVANWILYGYALPLVAFLLAARLIRGLDLPRLVTGLEAGAIMTAFGLITLEIRQCFHPGHLAAGHFPLLEWAWLASGWLGLGVALLGMQLRCPRPSLIHGGRLLVGLGTVLAVFVLGLAQNPVLQHHAVGHQVILNWLLFIYGVPAILSLVATSLLLKLKDVASGRWLGALGLLMVFVLVTLQVRQAFHGNFLDAVGMSGPAERYAYSLAWVVFGAVLLVLGIVLRGVVLRYASLAVILLAMAKVFLFDTAHLQDLYRVFSFLGLGLSLLVLAYVYQRFVFRKPDRADDDSLAL